MKMVIDSLACDIRAGKRESSVMTTYPEDDQDIWRQFRRELIGEGFTSETIRKFSKDLKIYLRTLSAEGRLDEEPPGSPSPSQKDSLVKIPFVQLSLTVSRFQQPSRKDPETSNDLVGKRPAKSYGPVTQRPHMTYKHPTVSDAEDSEPELLHGKFEPEVESKAYNYKERV